MELCGKQLPHVSNGFRSPQETIDRVAGSLRSTVACTFSCY